MLCYCSGSVILLVQQVQFTFVVMHLRIYLWLSCVVLAGYVRATEVRGTVLNTALAGFLLGIVLYIDRSTVCLDGEKCMRLA